MTQDLYIDESVVAPEHQKTTQEPTLPAEVSLIELLTELARNKWLIAKVTGAAALAGVTLSFVLPVRYTAVTKLMPPQQTQSASSMMMSQLASSGAGPLAAIAGAGLGLKSPNDIYVGMLNSRPVADAIIIKFNLQTAYRDKNMSDARKDLADNTQILSEKSGFISIAATDRDKERSAAIANEYTEQLRSITRTIAVTEASQRRMFYEGQLKDAKEALISSEASFEQVQQNKGLVQLDAQAKAMIESLSALRAQVAAKEVQLQALRSYSTDRNPEVEIAQRELVSLRDQVARLEQRNNSSGFGDLGLKDVPGAGLDYLRAEHEVKYRQALFDLLIKQYDAARLDEAKEAAIIQVVEPAIEPDRKSSPKRVLIVVSITLLAFLGSLFYCLVDQAMFIARRNPEIDQQILRLKDALRHKHS